jgi:hypothetical protein
MKIYSIYHAGELSALKSCLSRQDALYSIANTINDNIKATFITALTKTAYSDSNHNTFAIQSLETYDKAISLLCEEKYEELMNYYNFDIHEEELTEVNSIKKPIVNQDVIDAIHNYNKIKILQ